MGKLDKMVKLFVNWRLFSDFLDSKMAFLVPSSSKLNSESRVGEIAKRLDGAAAPSGVRTPGAVRTPGGAALAEISFKLNYLNSKELIS